MKRYKYNFWKGLIEDSEGAFCKVECLQQSQQKATHYEVLYNQKFREVANQNITIFILKWLLFLSILGNSGQLIYHINT